MNINSLIKSGRVKISSAALDNPVALSTPELCLGVAAEEYPAQTPRLWNNAFKQLGLHNRMNVRLIGHPQDDAEIFSAFRHDHRYVGGDVGVGHKDKVGPLLDRLDPLAEAMAAINVVVKENGHLVGYNTDGAGFTKALSDLLNTQDRQLFGQHILILGGGGTANAIAFSLADKGATVTILNRTVGKAQMLSERINLHFGKSVAQFGGRDHIAEAACQSNVVVVALDDPNSPLNEYNAFGPIELPAIPENLRHNLTEAKIILGTMHHDTIIADVMLRDKETATLKQAREMGFTVLDGKPMVINQAIEAFWLVNHPALVPLGKTKDDVAAIMRRHP